MACLMVLACAPAVADPFSRSNPAEVTVTHVELDLRVSFTPKELTGRVVLHLARSEPGKRQELVLDTKDLRIEAVAGARKGRRFSRLEFRLGPSDPVLGSALSITLPPGVERVRIGYRAGRDADALQWLDGRQTRDGRPFFYTQSGTIHARSWIPIQDSPALRFTWEAKVRVPRGLVPVMSATLVSRSGSTRHFRTTHPVPAYLVALAVGDLAFRAWDGRTGVFAERTVVEGAHGELRDTPRMLEVAEGLFGPYRWDRYDLLVMPPAFPYGGVENPQLTFVTPSLLVGDRSLVSTVAHELAHGWAGNLVTQATWNDVWLNEGLTVYLERRIVEELYGTERAMEEAVLGRHQLREELATLPAADQRLLVDFAGRNPDDTLTSVPYEKGYLLFLKLEREAGRAKLDAFLRGLFRDCAFQSLTTAQFLERLRGSLPAPVEAWVDGPGLPADAPDLSSEALEAAGRAATEWVTGAAATDLPARSWSPRQWAWFLTRLPRTIDGSRADALDRAWHLTGSRNSTVLVPWLRLGIRSGHVPAMARTEEILRTVGRGRIVVPLYEELLALPDGPARAARIYCEARSAYHPVVASALDRRIRCDGR
jgi:aminopeptidase N